MARQAEGSRPSIVGSYRWLESQLLIEVPDTTWLLRLDDLLGLKATRIEDRNRSPEISVLDDNVIRYFDMRVPFDSLNDLLIWLTLTCVDLLAEMNRLLLLHAASVVVEDRVVLVFGPPHSGKSSLSRYALSTGFDLLGDDVVHFLSDTGQVEAVPRPLKTRTTDAELRLDHPDPFALGQDLFGRLHGEPGVLTPRSRAGIMPLGQGFDPRSLCFLKRHGGPGVTSYRPSRFESLTSLLNYARDWSTPPLSSARKAAEGLLGLPSRVIDVGDHEQEAALETILSVGV